MVFSRMPSDERACAARLKVLFWKSDQLDTAMHHGRTIPRRTQRQAIDQ